jgi:hypothetical protein
MAPKRQRAENVVIAPVDNQSDQARPSSSTSEAVTGKPNLITLLVFVKMVTVGSKKDAGSQVSFSDGQSHRDEKPNDRHGTSTTTKAPCNALNLPTPPKGVVVANQGLKPPNSNENPFKGISWTWVLTSYGTSTATIKKAVHFATDFGISMLQKCISNINTKLPGSVPSKSFTAESTVLQNRVAIARSGQKMSGGTYTIRDLINIRIDLASNLPINIRKEWLKFAHEYPAVITLEGVETQVDASQIRKRPASTMLVAPKPHKQRKTMKAKK